MPPILHGARAPTLTAAGQRQHGRASSISEEDLSRAGSSRRGSLTGLDGGTAELCARLEAIAQKLEGSGVGGGASAEAIKKLLDEQQKRWARARPARRAAPPFLVRGLTFPRAPPGGALGRAGLEEAISSVAHQKVNLPAAPARPERPCHQLLLRAAREAS